MNRHVSIVGVAQTPVRKAFPGTVLDIAFEVISNAIADAGISKSEVDSLVVSPAGLGGPPSFMWACALAEYLQIETKNLSLVECGGMTSTVAIKNAMSDIRSGRTRRAVVMTMDHRTQLFPAEVGGFMHDAVRMQTCLYGPYEGPYGIGAPIPFYAMSAQRYMHEYGVSARDIAEASVMLRRHAQENPDALYHEPISVDEVLSSKMMSPPIHLLECSAFACGAAAMVLVHPDDADSIRPDYVDVVGFGEFHHPSHFVPLRGSITRFVSVEKASVEAYEDAGIGPTDLDLAEVYGVFSATELMLYEDLGLCKKGKGAGWLKEGKSTYGGEVVMCPSGGRLSFGHPAGATPLMEVVEVAHQLRGEAGPRQVSNAVLGLVHAEHGMLNGSMVLILKRGDA